MKPLIFDATPLIYLGKVNLIENVRHFPEEKYITKSVYREVVVEGKKSGTTEVFMIEALVSSGVFQFKSPSKKQYIKYLGENPKIHEADIDVLALTQELNGIALLDDDEARGMAEVEGIEHHGTVYLLLRMWKMKLLTKEMAIESLNEMIRFGWRCSTELYAKILMAMK
ncbi:MAG: DUF3368 domain-containing protein [Euryarchaeota archaeon]|nr:DUF3368 domain-containing protein [Euryarchaeota archaeon]